MKNNQNKKKVSKKKKKSFLKILEKKLLNNKTKFKMTETITFMLITFAFGLVIGGVIMYGKGLWGFKNTSSLNEFVATYNDIVDTYYEDVDSEKLLEAGISGMMRYLGDPYSVYMKKETAEVFSEDVEGKYSGIGAEIKINDKKQIVIGKVFEDSPAYEAGLKTDDILIKVNGESVKGLNVSEIAELVKGEDDTIVTLTVLRDKKELDIDIMRGIVNSISVTSDIFERDSKKIGYLKLSIFAANTFDQFEKELKKLEDDGIDRLIIDVRSNSGGYLTSVTDIISKFITKGDALYVLKTKDKMETIKDKTDEKRTYPIVVLVNGASASASEVLTGALQETYGATIVGTKTFGKGKVQKAYTLSNGAMVKYTFQEWLTPKENYIDEVGIMPDEEIAYEMNKEGKDNQLEKAIEIILKK